MRTRKHIYEALTPEEIARRNEQAGFNDMTSRIKRAMADKNDEDLFDQQDDTHDNSIDNTDYERPDGRGGNTQQQSQSGRSLSDRLKDKAQQNRDNEQRRRNGGLTDREMKEIWDDLFGGNDDLVDHETLRKAIEKETGEPIVDEGDFTEEDEREAVNKIAQNIEDWNTRHKRGKPEKNGGESAIVDPATGEPIDVYQTEGGDTEIGQKENGPSKGGRGLSNRFRRIADTMNQKVKPVIDWQSEIRRLFDATEKVIARQIHSNRAHFTSEEYDKGLGVRTINKYEERQNAVDHLFVLIDNSGSFEDAVAPLLSEIYTAFIDNNINKMSIAYFSTADITEGKVRTWYHDTPLEEVKMKIKRHSTDDGGGTDIQHCVDSLYDLDTTVFDPVKTKLIIMSDYESNERFDRMYVMGTDIFRNATHIIVRYSRQAAMNTRNELIEYGIDGSNILAYEFDDFRKNALGKKVKNVFDDVVKPDKV